MIWAAARSVSCVSKTRVRRMLSNSAMISSRRCLPEKACQAAQLSSRKEEPAPSPEELARIQAEREAKIAAAKAAAAAKRLLPQQPRASRLPKARGETPVTEEPAKPVDKQ